MTDVKLTVGGSFEEDAARRFVDAWHRSEQGETFHERHLAFESWDALMRVLTAKRLELLRHVHRQPASSVRALARALGRDYSNVHADVQALIARRTPRRDRWWGTSRLRNNRKRRPADACSFARA